MNLTAACVEVESGFIAMRCLKKRTNRVVIRDVSAPEQLRTPSYMPA